MAPPNGDIENGDVEKEARRDTVVDDGQDLGEYGNLVKYISNFRDGRRASVAGTSVYEDEPKKKWYQFGKKKGGADGTFDTPEEWLGTDWKQGLTTHDVEQRRRKTGFNELTTEKENMFLKFLSYFTGPILYGTLSAFTHVLFTRKLTFWQLWNWLFYWLPVSVIGLISVLLSVF